MVKSSMALCIMVTIGISHLSSADCGQPPISTAVNESLKQAVHSLACSSSALKGNLDVVIEDIPLGAGFSMQDRQCSGAEMKLEEARSIVDQYLTTSDSLLAAECGYRLCKMGATATPQALEILGRVCSRVRPDTTGGVALVSEYVRAVRSCGDDLSNVVLRITNHNPAGSPPVHLKKVIFDPTSIASIKPRLIETEIAHGQTITIPIAVRFLRKVLRTRDVNFVVSFSDRDVSSLTGTLSLTPDYVTTRIENPASPWLAVDTDEQVSNGYGHLACPGGRTIGDYHSWYCTNAGKKTNCYACTIGSTSCEVFHNNSTCGDCAVGSVKHGRLEIRCDPDRLTCDGVCHSHDLESWPEEADARDSTCSCRAALVDPACKANSKKRVPTSLAR